MGIPVAVLQQKRQAILDAWQLVKGRQPTTFEEFATESVGALETGLGRWPFEDIDGAPVENPHNWGAIQATDKDPNFVWASDSYQDGTRFPQKFVAYATDADGAAALVRQLVSPSRPLTEAAMAAGGNLADVARAMRRENYFGGICPVAAAKYGASAVRGMKLDTDARIACAEEAIPLYARNMWTEASAYARANGLPVPAAPPAPAVPGSTSPWLIGGVAAALAAAGGLTWWFWEPAHRRDVADALARF